MKIFENGQFSPLAPQPHICWFFFQQRSQWFHLRNYYVKKYCIYHKWSIFLVSVISVFLCTSFFSFMPEDILSLFTKSCSKNWPCLKSSHKKVFRRVLFPGGPENSTLNLIGLFLKIANTCVLYAKYLVHIFSQSRIS